MSTQEESGAEVSDKARAKDVVTVSAPAMPFDSLAALSFVLA